MRRLSAALKSALEMGAVCLLVVLCAVTLLGVVDRYLLHTGIGWTEEMGRFLLIWSSLLSAAVVTYHSGHFSVCFLVDMFPAGLRRAVDALMTVIDIAILLLVFWLGIRVTSIMRMQASPGMQLTMSWVYLSLPLATGAMVLFLILQLTGLAPSPGEKNEP